MAHVAFCLYYQIRIYLYLIYPSAANWGKQIGDAQSIVTYFLLSIETSMHKLNISARIYLLVALSLLTAGVLAYVGISSIIETRTALRSQELSSITDSAVGILQGSYDRVEAGEIEKEAALTAALRAMEDIRYRGNEYMFVVDTEGVMVMHPFAKALVGNNQLQMKDANGKPIFRDMIDLATKNGSGYLQYVWPRGADKVPVDKNSYVSFFLSLGA